MNYLKIRKTLQNQYHMEPHIDGFQYIRIIISFIFVSQLQNYLVQQNSS